MGATRTCPRGKVEDETMAADAVWFLRLIDLSKFGLYGVA
jgi:hypothetical protein